MTWNLTRKTPPEELAALLDEVVHQRKIGTPLAEGVSVCGQTQRQCSTSTTGEGVTCPLCLEHVTRWAEDRAEEERRRERKRQTDRAARQRAAAKRQAAGRVNLTLSLPLTTAADVDALVAGGFFPSRRQVHLHALDAFLAERAGQIERGKLAAKARQVALQTAQDALQFAGVVEDAPSPSRHATSLKRRLMAVERRLMEDGD